MNNDFKNAVKGWLETIMPSVAATIANVLTPETLSECAKEEAIHGPYTINIDEFAGPITAISFHVMVVQEIVMLAVNGTIRNNEEFSTDIKFDMVFSCNDLVEKIQEKEQLVTLVADLLAQVEEGYKEK